MADELVRFRLMNSTQRVEYLCYPSGCASCALIPHSMQVDARSCISCRRGGLVDCDVSMARPVSSDVGPQALTGAIDLLRRTHSRCDDFAQGLESRNDRSEPSFFKSWPSGEHTGGPPHVDTPHGQETVVMEMIVGVDQKVQMLQQYASQRACEPCRRRKTRCSWQSTSRGSQATATRRRRSLGGPFVPVLPLTEELSGEDSPSQQTMEKDTSIVS